MKGISPFIAAVLLIAFTVAVGGIISLFVTRLTATQTGEVERGAAGVAECVGVYIYIEAVTLTAGGNGTILVNNPSRNRIYVQNFYDNLGNVSTVVAAQRTINPGTIGTISNINITSTATKITATGYCENSAGTANVSITGTCPKGGTCWPS